MSLTWLRTKRLWKWLTDTSTMSQWICIQLCMCSTRVLRAYFSRAWGELQKERLGSLCLILRCAHFGNHLTDMGHGRFKFGGSASENSHGYGLFARGMPHLRNHNNRSWRIADPCVGWSDAGLGLGAWAHNESSGDWMYPNYPDFQLPGISIPALQSMFISLCVMLLAWIMWYIVRFLLHQWQHL